MEFSNGKGIFTLPFEFSHSTKGGGSFISSFSSLTCYEFKLGFVEVLLLAQRLFHSNSFTPPRGGDEVFEWEGDFHPPIRILPFY